MCFNFYIILYIRFIAPYTIQGTPKTHVEHARCHYGHNLEVDRRHKYGRAEKAVCRRHDMEELDDKVVEVVK